MAANISLRGFNAGQIDVGAGENGQGEVIPSAWGYRTTKNLITMIYLLGAKLNSSLPT